MSAVSGYGSWWDVPIAEVSESDSVQDTFERYTEARKKERTFL